MSDEMKAEHRRKCEQAIDTIRNVGQKYDILMLISRDSGFLGAAISILGLEHH